MKLNSFTIKTLLTGSLMALLGSCDLKQDLDDAPAPSAKAGVAHAAGDGAYDLLGYGYNATGQYANSISSTFPIVDVARLKADHATYVDQSGAETGTILFETAQNAEEFVLKLTSKVSIGGSYNELFKGSIDENFSSTDKFSSKYVYAMYSQKVIKRRVRMVPDYAMLRSYLHQDFVNNLQTKSPYELVNIYGTHVLSDIKLGGEVSLIYRAQTSSTERANAGGAGAEFSYAKVFNASVSQTYDANLRLSNSNERVMARTVGGNAQSTVKEVTFSANGTPSASIDISSWSAGVTDANAEMIDISPGGAIALYELVADANQRAALKAYIDQYIIDNAVRLAYESDANNNVFSVTDGMGYVAQGGGVALGNINGNATPDGVFMAYDAPAGPNQFRYKVANDMGYGVPTSFGPVQYVDGLGWDCEGAGITLADIDRNGQTDIILMAYDARTGPNAFLYKVGFNIDANGATTNWSPVREVSGISEMSKGAGISFGDIDKNGTLDLVLMAYDYYSGIGQLRYKVGYNIDVNGSTANWSSLRNTYGMGDLTNGAAISLTDIDGDNNLDLVAFIEDNPNGQNQYRYKVGYNLNTSGIASYWGGVNTQNACGWESEGAGIAFANLDATPAKEVVIMSVDAGAGQNEIKYKVGFNLNSSGATTIWR